MKRISDSVRPWIVLAVVSGLAANSIGISVNTGGVFYTAVCEDLNLLRGDFAMNQTLLLIAMAFFSLIVPTLYKRFSYKLLLRTAVIGTVAAGAAMAFGSSLFLFNLLGILRGIFSAMISFVFLTMMINAWFKKKNALAVSICFAMTGVTGSLMSVILGQAIESMGWRMGYIVMAICMLVLSLPSLLVPYDLQPEAHGFKPLMEQESVTQAFETAQNSNSSALKANPIIWVSLFILSVCASFLTSFSQHFPGYCQSLGYSASLAAGLLSIAMIGNVLFKLLIGIVADKIGAVKAVFAMFALVGFGLILVVMGFTPLFLNAGSLLFGAIYSIAAVAMVFLTQTFFDAKLYNKVYPSISMAGNLGAAFSLTVIGYIYDFFGSYLVAFLIGAGLIALSVVCILICVSQKSLEQENKAVSDLRHIS